MDQHRGVRVQSALRNGSSWPVFLETEAGTFFTKLRGAAQGTSALIAEIVSAELAECLGLKVPRRVLINLEKGVPSQDPHGELRQLLDQSAGLNLGFEVLSSARDLTLNQLDRVPPSLQAQIVWFDAWIMNVDRTPQNPNLMLRGNEVWLIDHGAALTFQHDWRNVREQTPREAGDYVPRHLFQVPSDALWEWDATLAELLPREALERALAQVPDDFLRAQTTHAAGGSLERERAAYVAFLWKRLKDPRPFLPGIVFGRGP